MSEMKLPLTNWLLIISVCINAYFALTLYGDVNFAAPLIKLDPIIKELVELK